LGRGILYERILRVMREDAVLEVASEGVKKKIPSPGDGRDSCKDGTGLR